MTYYHEPQGVGTTHLHVKIHPLNVVLHDDEPVTSAKLTAGRIKVPGPPTSRGTPPDDERAKRPPLPALKNVSLSAERQGRNFLSSFCNQ
jgi:hypothetical protein